MANAFLTPTAVTREALRVLHQKLNFVGTITRDYDDSFARQGAQIAACDAARALAVQTHAAEHDLQDQFTKAQRGSR